MFNAAVQHKGPYLLVIASGHAELPELCALADFSAKVASMRSCKRVLYDLLALERELTPEEHCRLGAYLAAAFHHFERVAAVRPDLQGYPNVPLGIFLTLKEAEEWLTRD